MRKTIAVLLAGGMLATPAAALVVGHSHLRNVARPRCTAARGKGAVVKLRNALAVVWKHGRSGGFDRLYSCVYRVGRVRRLPAQEGTYKLGGTWLAYVYAGSAIGDESDKIGELSLVTYRHRIIAHLSPGTEGFLSETDNGGRIPNYAVAANGNIVWLTTNSRFDPMPLELRAGDGRPPRERIVDAGAIDPTTLRLRADGRRVSYTKGGQRTSTRLR